MKIVCAWCEKDLGEKPPLDNPATTHGICESCLVEARRDLHRYLDELDNSRHFEKEVVK